MYLGILQVFHPTYRINQTTTSSTVDQSLLVLYHFTWSFFHHLLLSYFWPKLLLTFQKRITRDSTSIFFLSGHHRSWHQHHYVDIDINFDIEIVIVIILYCTYNHLLSSYSGYYLTQSCPVYQSAFHTTSGHWTSGFRGSAIHCISAILYPLISILFL